MNKNLINKVLIVGFILFVFGILVYNIKCPNPITIKEIPYTVEYPAGSTVWWEFSYINEYLFFLVLLSCIFFLIENRIMKWIIGIMAFFILIKLGYSSYLISLNIHKYDLIENLKFWIFFFVGTGILVLWLIKYFKR